MSRRYHASEIEKTVLGEKVTVHVSNDGVFSAYISHESIKADTMNELMGIVRKKLMKARVQVEIPATIIDYKENAGTRWNPIWKRVAGQGVVITGLALKSGGGVTLIKDDGEKIVQDRFSHFGSRLFKRMSPDAIREYVALKSAVDKATKQFDAFEKKWKIDDAEELVKKAIAEKVDTPEEPEEEVDGDPR